MKFLVKCLLILALSYQIWDIHLLNNLEKYFEIQFHDIQMDQTVQLLQ